MIQVAILRHFTVRSKPIASTWSSQSANAGHSWLTRVLLTQGAMEQGKQKDAEIQP